MKVALNREVSKWFQLKVAPNRAVSKWFLLKASLNREVSGWFRLFLHSPAGGSAMMLFITSPASVRPNTPVMWHSEPLALRPSHSRRFFMAC